MVDNTFLTPYFQVSYGVFVSYNSLSLFFLPFFHYSFSLSLSLCFFFHLSLLLSVSLSVLASIVFRC